MQDYSAVANQKGVVGMTTATEHLDIGWLKPIRKYNRPINTDA